ncbi:MAG: DnaT-like ssDNA-binding protein [Blastocatellia bacterium]
MPVPALDTTIGGAAANSYVTLEEAENYFDAHLKTAAWTDATSDDKTRALLMAANRLQVENWLGARATTTQRLAWPRIGVAKRDSADYSYSQWGYGGGYGYGFPYSGYGEPYLPTEIPQQVKDAQCEFAFAYLSGTYNDSGEAEVKSFADDKMRVEFDQPKLAGRLPAEVTRLIAGLTAQNRRVRG